LAQLHLDISQDGNDKAYRLVTLESPLAFIQVLECRTDFLENVGALLKSRSESRLCSLHIPLTVKSRDGSTESPLLLFRRILAENRIAGSDLSSVTKDT
jgi:hypothetical protein